MERIRSGIVAVLLSLYTGLSQAGGELPDGAAAVLEWRAQAPNGRVWHLFEVVSPSAGGWDVSLRDEDGREILGLELAGPSGVAVAVRTPAERRVPLEPGPLGEVSAIALAAAAAPTPPWPPRLLLAAASDGSGRGLARHCEPQSLGELRCVLLWTGVPPLELDMVLVDAWHLTAE